LCAVIHHMSKDFILSQNMELDLQAKVMVPMCFFENTIHESFVDGPSMCRIVIQRVNGCYNMKIAENIQDMEPLMIKLNCIRAEIRLFESSLYEFEAFEKRCSDRIPVGKDIVPERASLLVGGGTMKIALEEVVDEIVVDCTGCVSNFSSDTVLVECDVEAWIDDDVIGPVTVKDSPTSPRLWIDDVTVVKSMIEEKMVMSQQEQFGVNRAYNSSSYFEKNGIGSDYRYCYVQMDYIPLEENPWWTVQDNDSFQFKQYCDFLWNKDVLFNYRVFQSLPNQSFNFDVMRVFIMSPDTAYTIRCLVRDSVMLVSNNMIVLEDQPCYRSVFQNEGDLVVVLSSELISEDLRPSHTSHKIRDVLKSYCDQYNSKPREERSCFCDMVTFRTWVALLDDYHETSNCLCFRRKKVRALYLKNIDRDRKIVVFAFCLVSPYLNFHGFNPSHAVERNKVEEKLREKHIVVFDKKTDSVTIPLIECSDYRCYCKLVGQRSFNYKGIEDEYAFFTQLREFRKKNLVLVFFGQNLIKVSMNSHPIDKMFHFVKSAYERRDFCCYDRMNFSDNNSEQSDEYEVEGDTYCEMNDPEQVYNIHHRDEIEDGSVVNQSNLSELAWMILESQKEKKIDENSLVKEHEKDKEKGT